jgi:hypothetical protein
MADENVEALAALYQAEKADTSGMFNASMALMGVGAAYIVGAIGYLSRQQAHTLPGALVALAPAPLWLITAFQSLITLATMMHTIFVGVVEDELIGLSGLKKERVENVGSKGASEIMDIANRDSHWIHKLTTLFVYGGIVAMVLGFTAYSLDRAWPYLSQQYQIAFTVAYISALLLIVSCWLIGLRKVVKAVEDAKPAEDAKTTATGTVA